MCTVPLDANRRRARYSVFALWRRSWIAETNPYGPVGVLSVATVTRVSTFRNENPVSQV
jgi:hypothetical protein